MAPSGALIEDVGGLEAVRAEWDALAVAAARPYCAPAWMLAWWRTCPLARARPRPALVWFENIDGRSLAGAARRGMARPGQPVAAAGLERPGPDNPPRRLELRRLADAQKPQVQGHSRRNRKQIEKRGGEFRVARTEEDLER